MLTPNLQKKFNGESSTADILRKLLLARDIAHGNSEMPSDSLMPFYLNQLVLMDEHSFLTKTKNFYQMV